MKSALKPQLVNLARIILFVILVGLYLPSSWSQESSSIFDNPVVAQNDDFKIHRDELNSEYIIYKNEVEKTGKIRLNPLQKYIYEENLLKRIAFSRILVSKATEEEKTSSLKEAQQEMNAAKSDPDKSLALKAQILSLALTEEKFLEKLVSRKTGDKVLFRLLADKIAVSQAEVQSYYDSNPSLFVTPTIYEVAHIMISTRNQQTGEPYSAAQIVDKKMKAEEIAEEASKKEVPFGELVLKHSEDVRTKKSGGVLKFVQGQLDPTFESVAMNMLPDQISRVVTTRFGYHIIKFIQRIDSKSEPLQGKLAEDIKSKLRVDKLRKVVPPFQAQLLKENEVEFLLNKEDK